MDTATFTWSDLDEANKRDGHYQRNRRDGRLAAAEQLYQTACQEHDELVDRWLEGANVTFDEMQASQEKRDAIATYYNECKRGTARPLEWYLQAHGITITVEEPEEQPYGNERDWIGLQ